MSFPNPREFYEKVNYTTIKGKRYPRKIVGRDFLATLSWLEKRRAFENPDLSFTEHYLKSIIRNQTCFDIYDYPLRTLVEKMTLSWKGILIIPECEVCKTSLTFVDFLQREEEFFPIWICLPCSQRFPNMPKTYLQGIDAKDVTKTELERITQKLKEILREELGENLVETMKAYDGDFEGSYQVYDDEDTESEE